MTRAIMRYGRSPRAIKHLIERSLVSTGLNAVVRRRRVGQTLVLAFHNIIPHGERSTGDCSLHLPQRLFAQLLDSLAQTHAVVPLTEVLSAPADPRRPRISITFDDAYAGAVTAGVDEVVQRGLPATIFVTPSFVDGGTFWWDEVADLASGEVPAPLREHCLWALEGRAEAVRSWGDAAGLARQEMPQHQRGASQHDIAQAVKNPGITLGNHSWSHANLAALGPEQLAAELTQPMAWLHERFDSVIPWVSYPYGLHSDRVERAVREAGLEAGMRVDGGWMNGTQDDTLFQLPRLNIPSGLTVAGFQLRTSGLR